MNNLPQGLAQRGNQHLTIARIALLVLIILGGIFRTETVFSEDYFHINPNLLKKASDKWGSEAPKRLHLWENLIHSDKSSTDLEKLEKVNIFINKTMTYAEDIDVWGVPDYWATPLEFIGKGAGDCEEFAIAKYFTLKAMGIPDQRLQIAYVKALKLDRFHMVLTYVIKPGDEPLVLDNLINNIKPATARRDLSPIFSFNGTDLWMAQQRGKGEVTDSKRLRPWRDLLKRMSEDNL
jgi:predicted transglutaminase-like cysteine proteinase